MKFLIWQNHEQFFCCSSVYINVVLGVAENLNYMNNYDFVGEFNQGVAIVIKDNLYGAVTIGGMKSYLLFTTIYLLLMMVMQKQFKKESAKH